MLVCLCFDDQFMFWEQSGRKISKRTCNTAASECTLHARRSPTDYRHWSCPRICPEIAKYLLLSAGLIWRNVSQHELLKWKGCHGPGLQKSWKIMSNEMQDRAKKKCNKRSCHNHTGLQRKSSFQWGGLVNMLTLWENSLNRFSKWRGSSQCHQVIKLQTIIFSTVDCWSKNWFP